MEQNMNKTDEIKVKVTPETKTQIQKQAENLGLSVSAYGRMKLLEDLPRQKQTAKVEA